MVQTSESLAIEQTKILKENEKFNYKLSLAQEEKVKFIEDVKFALKSLELQIPPSDQIEISSRIDKASESSEDIKKAIF